MYIVIVGCGRIGNTLARTLIKVGHEVLVLEKDRRRCEVLESELGSVALEADGCQVQGLRDAGVSRAQVLVATTGNDADNLACCQIAKAIFNVPTTMSVVNRPENEAFFEQLGVDTVVNAAQLVLSTLEKEIAGRPFVHLTNLEGTEDLRLVSLRIPEDAAVNGKSLNQIQLPPDTFLTLVVKDGETFVPGEETVLNSGDEVIAVTSASEEEVLWEVLSEVAT
jgi:trk system potassium uptake protein TrkA